jgi:hypothetical protein
MKNQENSTLSILHFTLGVCLACLIMLNCNLKNISDRLEILEACLKKTRY